LQANKTNPGKFAQGGTYAICILMAFVFKVVPRCNRRGALPAVAFVARRSFMRRRERRRATLANCILSLLPKDAGKFALGVTPAEAGVTPRNTACGQKKRRDGVNSGPKY